MYRINNPFLYFPDLSGNPLNDGYLYFGSVGTNPELTTNQITVYWDYDGTQPAAQPIRTINGQPARNGTPAQLFINVDCSLSIKNSNLNLVTYLSNANLFNAVSEWINPLPAAYVTNNTFTVSGDQTSIFHLGRRIKCTGGADRYMHVVSSAYTTLTTVTVESITDSSGATSTLHASMNTAYLSILSANYTSANKNYYEILDGEVGVTDLSYIWGYYKRYGAVGDLAADDITALNNLITSCVALRIIPDLGSGSFKITSTLNLQKQGLKGDKRYRAYIEPSSAVTRAIDIGNTNLAASGSGTIENVTIGMYNMPNNSVAIESDYGVSSWRFINIGVLDDTTGSAIATANKTGIKFYKSTNGDTQFYNLFRNCNFTKINTGIDLSSGWNVYRSNDNHFEYCRFFTCNYGILIQGDNNTLKGFNWSPGTTVAEGFDNNVDIRGSSNIIIGGYADSSGPNDAKWWKISPSTTIINPINLTFVDGLIQYYSDENGTIETTTTFTNRKGLIHGASGRIDVGEFHNRKNLLINANFTNWAYGTSSVDPTTATHVLPGWKGAKNGATYTVSKETTNVYRNPTALKIVCTVASTTNPCGITQEILDDTSVGIDRGMSSESFEGQSYTALAIVKGAAGGEVFRLTAGGTTTDTVLTTSWIIVRCPIINIANGAGLSNFNITVGLQESTGTIYVDSVFLMPGQFQSTSVIPKIDYGHYETVFAAGHNDIAAATTLGSVTKKLPIYDLDGTVLGYIPLYDAIT